MVDKSEAKEENRTVTGLVKLSGLKELLVKKEKRTNSQRAK